MSERPGWDGLWAWVDDGQRRVEASAAALDDAAMSEPVTLDSWTRGHVLSHLARNADALVNLLNWAGTGVETPMYPSMDARAEGIDAGAERPASVHRGDLIDSAATLRRRADELAPDRRTYGIVSAQGRPITAEEVPWMRNREVWLHHVDLDVGFTMDDLPDDVAAELVRDIAGWMSTRVAVTIDLQVEGEPAPVRVGGGEVATSVVSGSAHQLAGWLSGRSGPDRLQASNGFPELPPWL